MTLRRRLGLAAAAAYVGALVYTTSATQCPVEAAHPAASEAAAGRITCAMVHALVHGARPPAAQPAIAAVPMRAPAARDHADPLLLAAAAR